MTENTMEDKRGERHERIGKRRGLEREKSENQEEQRGGKRQKTEKEKGERREA